MLDKEYLESRIPFYNKLYDMNIRLVWNGSINLSIGTPGEYIPNMGSIHLVDYHFDTRYVMRFFLHELAHAIQHKRNALHGYGFNLEKTVNMEVACEKFSRKEYERRYRHLGPFPSDWIYNAESYIRIFKPKRAKRKLRYFEKRLVYKPDMLLC